MLSMTFLFVSFGGGSLFSIFGLKEECVACKANQIIQNINKYSYLSYTRKSSKIIAGR